MGYRYWQREKNVQYKWEREKQTALRRTERVTLLVSVSVSRLWMCSLVCENQSIFLRNSWRFRRLQSTLARPLTHLPIHPNTRSPFTVGNRHSRINCSCIPDANAVDFAFHLPSMYAVSLTLYRRSIHTTILKSLSISLETCLHARVSLHVCVFVSLSGEKLSGREWEKERVWGEEF